MADVTTAIVAEAKRLEEDTLYSAKGHFETAARWERFNLAVGLIATVAAALAAVFTLSHNDALVILLAVCRRERSNGVRDGSSAVGVEGPARSRV